MNKNLNQQNDMSLKRYYKSNQTKETENLNVLLNKYNINKSQYIIRVKDDYYNPNNLIDKKNAIDLKCPICLNILNIPKSCSSNNNSHSFCKKCIDKYLKDNNNCPICRQHFSYKTNNKIEKKIIEVKFRCNYFYKGCKQILNYYTYFNHINECIYRNIQYKCQVEKYNYINKQFEKCHYISNNKLIENHFKKCALVQYKCNFCKEKILAINIKDHFENNCKIRIINYEDGSIYIGEIKNNKKDGLGKIYSSSGIKYYDGEWKNDRKEGYGRLFINNIMIYEGEWKNDKKEGYGIMNLENGKIYKGEWKNDIFEGCGILNVKNWKYEGIIKGGELNGFGIVYIQNKINFEGEWKNSLMEGFGIYYNQNGIEYEGYWKKGKIEGFGIFYNSNEITYKGFFKDSKYEEGRNHDENTGISDCGSISSHYFCLWKTAGFG